MRAYVYVCNGVSNLNEISWKWIGVYEGVKDNMCQPLLKLTDGKIGKLRRMRL